MAWPICAFLLGLSLLLPPAAIARPKNPRDDVNEIGNRNVGKGLNWYSQAQEIQMGKALSEEVEAQSRMVDDPLVNEYVNRLVQNIVRNSDARVPFTVKLIDSDDVNAFAFPGGFLFVNSGLLLAADDEAQFAGVIAHEVAHVAARHVTRQETRGELFNLATIPLIFVGGPLGMGAQAAASFLIPVGYLKFSRSFEREADYLGVQYLYKSGYDPNELVTFFEKIQTIEKKRPGTLAKAFSTHPQTPDRVQATQREIERILPQQPQYVLTTSEFDQVRARLAAYEKRSRGLKVRDRPTLRRRTTADTHPVEQNTPEQPDQTTTGGNDDARPTLRHHDPPSAAQP